MRSFWAIILSLFLAASVSALEIQITVPAEIEQDTIEAFAQTYQYQEEIEQDGEFILNPQSKEEFMIEKIAEFPRNVYKAYMGKEAEETKQSRETLAAENAEGITARKVEEAE